MMRLNLGRHGRKHQVGCFEAYYGGVEANVAAFLVQTELMRSL